MPGPDPAPAFVTTPPRRRWWSSVALWTVLGAAAGAGVFRASHDPRARRALGELAAKPELARAGRELGAVGKELAETAKDLGGEYLPAGEQPEAALPGQPSAAALAAPRDPAARFNTVPAAARVKTSRRARHMTRELRGGLADSGRVHDTRQLMGAPVLLDTFKIPFWRTDLGRGIKYSLCFAGFFGLVGYILFRNTERHARTF